MDYTNKDMDNAIAYSNNRYMLGVLNTLYTKLPHLISHLNYSIEQADPDKDYYYHSSFQTKAIKVKITIPEKLCDKISCNSVRGEKTCTRNDVADYYIIGDEAEFQRRCQPACFNLTDDPYIDEETGEEQVQMLRLSYNDRYGCIILPPAIVWHEIPFYRSDVRYEHRMNDLPAGFNLDKPDTSTYSQLTYKYNKSYCEAFYNEWDGKKCVTTIQDKILYAVVGESIIKLVKAGIESINSGFKTDYKKVDFPDIPEIEPQFLLDGWRRDINDDFVVPPVDFELPPMSQIIYRETLYDHTKLQDSVQDTNMNIIKFLKQKQGQISSNLRRRIEANYKLVINDTELSDIENVKKFNKTHSNIKLRTILNSKLKNDSEDIEIGEYIINIISAIFSSLTDSNFWLDMGIGIVSDVLLDQIKVVFRKLANELIPQITKKLLAVSGKVFSKVFASSLISTITNTMSKIMIKTVSKVMIQLTKLVAEIASVVGIILAIISIFDILLTIWDPLGFNNKFDEDVIKSVIESSDISMRKSLGVAIPQMSFNMFSNMIMTSEEIIEEGLNCYRHIYEYLDSLTVNSEGSRIDKGDEIDINNFDEDHVVDTTIVNSKHVTTKELYDYEYEHSQRMLFFKNTKKVIITTAIFGFLFLFMDLKLMAMLVFLIMLVLICLVYFNSSAVNIGKMIQDYKSFRI